MPAGRGGVIRLSYAPASALSRRAHRCRRWRLSCWRRLRSGAADDDPAWRRPRRSGLGRRRGAVGAGSPPAGRRRSSERPRGARAARPLARTATLFVPLAIVIWLAGGPMVLAVPLLAGLGWWRPRWLPPVALGSMLLAGVVAASAGNLTAMGSGAFGGLAQACALVALAAALMPAIAGAPGGRSGRSADLGEGAAVNRRLPSGETGPAGQLPRSPFELIDELSCYYDTPAEPNNVLARGAGAGRPRLPGPAPGGRRRACGRAPGPRPDSGRPRVPPSLHVGVPAGSRHRPAVPHHLVGRAGAGGDARPLHGTLAVAAHLAARPAAAGIGAGRELRDAERPSRRHGRDILRGAAP